MELSYSIDKSLITYVIEGKITSEDMRLLQEAKDRLSSNSSLKILAIVTSFKGYSSFEAMKKALLGDYRMLPNLTKYAIVTDSYWLRTVVSLLNYLVLKSELKAFCLSDHELAVKWLEL
ncbi:SpoIIAA-like protein [Algoriphagus ratkowskyi]|uniref:SpoIIAA-like protein n=1 Tax=Algoriphagus ratkowskyi TaxID=57028 RepID=A0A2W7RQL4_9BACT|nr:SpoIIAA-like protein [Algoriphagus ratkowskyi]